LNDHPRNLIGNGERIDSPQSLLVFLRESFRKAEEQSSDPKGRIQKALEGLQFLNALDLDEIPMTATTRMDVATTTVQSTASSSNPLEWLNSVEWLSPLSTMETDSTVDASIHLPLFPHSSPLLPKNDDDDHDDWLPLFSQFSDVPLAGMEIGLQIFEPRYRQLYQDVLSNGSKQLVVPFAHPHVRGQFAKYAWLYEIVRVQDIADETNGQVALWCQHLVTKPVRIDSIVNPSDWKTQFTYLRVQAQVLEEEEDENGVGMPEHRHELEQGLQSLLKRTTQQQDHSDLILKLLMALGEGNLWSVVHVWIAHLQMRVLDLQVQIAAEIQRSNKPQQEVDRDMIHKAQAPHRDELDSLLMELSTLVPLLLQEAQPKEQYQRLLQRIRDRLQT
jgi:Lon protease-like protein